MYVPSHFQLDEAGALAAVHARSAGTIVVAHDGGFEASLVPWVFDGDRLLGHVARPNLLARLLAEPTPCIVLFDIADAYVSPSFYPSKAEHHEVVPTWNYAAVHIHGTARAVDEPGWIRAQVDALTQRHESTRAEPWAVSDAPEHYVAKMAKGIIGIEVTIERVEGKAKLSQNKSDADRAGVVKGLAEEDRRPTVVDLMRAT